MEFFDGFGMHPSVYTGIPRRVDMFNEKQVQSYKAQTCGMWVIYFLLKRYRGFSMQSIVEPFNDINTNDIVIAEMFSDLYNVNIPPYF